jgi:DNA-binding IclR family transcriptional regulator
MSNPVSPRADATSAINSVDNALRLLVLLGERRVLRVAEVAELLNVARSTAHRLLSALRAHGFAVQDRSNGAYRPGPVLSEIGLAAIARVDIRQAARPALEDLRDRTQETVSLSLLEGRDIRFVDCIEGTRSVRVGSRTGITLPAHCTAGGKALLAALSLAELARRFADRDLPVRTENSVGDWPALDAELEVVRRDGYAVNLEEGEYGISAVAAALRDVTGAPLAAVAVVAPAGRLDADTARDLAPVVLGSAHRIEEELAAAG